MKPFGSGSHPAFQQIDLPCFERIFILRRHFFYLDHLDERTFLRLARDHGRTAVSPFGQSEPTAQIKSSLAGFGAVAFEAARLKNRDNVDLEIVKSNLKNDLICGKWVSTNPFIWQATKILN